MIENRNVPLPANWSGFLALPANKADLVEFLCQEIITMSQNDKVVVSGEDVKVTPSIPLTYLQDLHLAM